MRQLNELNVSFKFVNIYHTVQWTHVDVHMCHFKGIELGLSW